MSEIKERERRLIVRAILIVVLPIWLLSFMGIAGILIVRATL